MTHRVGDLVAQRREGNIQRARPSHEAEPDAARRRQVLEVPIGLAETPPGPVPRHAATQPAARPGIAAQRRTKPARSSRAPRRKRCSISRRPRRRSPRGSVARSPGVATILDGEPTTALRAAALQDLPAPLGRHALAEAVGLLPPSPIGLIRALHVVLRSPGVSKVQPWYRRAFAQVKRRARRRCARGDREGLTRPRAGVLSWAARFRDSMSIASRIAPTRPTPCRRTRTAPGSVLTELKAACGRLGDVTPTHPWTRPRLSTAVDKCVCNSHLRNS